MEKDRQTGQISPLMGMERTFFERHKQALCAQYASEVQSMVDAWEASATVIQMLRKKRFKNVRIVTFFGAITVRVRQGVDDYGRWISPTLAFLGIRTHQYYSPDMEKRMAVLAVETGSYEKAATVADATWTALSDDTARALVLRLGEIAADHPPNGMRPGAATKEDVLIVMADGWNARHRGKNWGRKKKDRNLPERVHWHEIRSAVIFRLPALLAVSEKRKAILDKHVVAVPAETSPLDFGLLLQREMQRMGARRAQNIVFIMDGAVWLWNIFADRFESYSEAMLDFYHLSQHLHALAAVLYASDATKAKAWCAKILHDLKHKSPARLFKTLDELLETPPSETPEVTEAIREQNAYFRKHEGHMDYADNAKLGIPIGSGSVESLCSQLQNRLKRTGQFWTKKGFAALLCISVRHWNQELDDLWFAQAA